MAVESDKMQGYQPVDVVRVPDGKVEEYINNSGYGGTSVVATFFTESPREKYTDGMSSDTGTTDGSDTTTTSATGGYETEFGATGVMTLNKVLDVDFITIHCEE